MRRSLFTLALFGFLTAPLVAITYPEQEPSWDEFTPTITEIDHQGDRVSITWTSRPEMKYMIQCSEDGENWFVADTIINGLRDQTIFVACEGETTTAEIPTKDFDDDGDGSPINAEEWIRFGPFPGVGELDKNLILRIQAVATKGWAQQAKTLYGENTSFVDWPENWLVCTADGSTLNNMPPAPIAPRALGGPTPLADVTDLPLKISPAKCDYGKYFQLTLKGRLHPGNYPMTGVNNIVGIEIGLNEVETVETDLLTQYVVMGDYHEGPAAQVMFIPERQATVEIGDDDRWPYVITFTLDKGVGTTDFVSSTMGNDTRWRQWTFMIVNDDDLAGILNQMGCDNGEGADE